uniref:Uncharacterized protein n=1 Tax=Astyanax mexicanus TaxID=7994 RepID=A0A8B9J7F5_ASTMX
VHSTQSTSWDHPRMIQLYQSMADLSEIRFSAYRTAMKLRRVQKLLKCNCNSNSMREGCLICFVCMWCTEVYFFFCSLYHCRENTWTCLINSEVCVRVCVRVSNNVHVGRTGRLRLLSLVTGLVSLCDADVKDKCKYLFWQVSGADGQCDAAHLSSLLNELIQIPRQLGEAAAFGGNSVEPSVNSCFRMV